MASYHCCNSACIFYAYCLHERALLDDAVCPKLLIGAGEHARATMAKRINSMNIAAVEYFDDASMIMGIVFGYGVGLLVLARCLRERLCSQSFKQTRLRRACLVSAGAAQGGPKPPRRRHCSKAPAALYFPACASGVVGKKSGNDDGPCTQPPGVCEHACSRARRGGLWRHGGLEGLRVRGAGGCLAVARVGDAGCVSSSSCRQILHPGFGTIRKAAGRRVRAA